MLTPREFAPIPLEGVPYFLDASKEVKKFHRGVQTESQKQGFIFEEKVSTEILDLLNDEDSKDVKVLAHRWIAYTDKNGANRLSCPDIMLFFPANILIIECKLSHSRQAIAQYEHYKVLLKAMYPKHIVSGLEISKTYDPFEAKWPIVNEIKPFYKDFSVFLWGS